MLIYFYFGTPWSYVSRCIYPIIFGWYGYCRWWTSWKLQCSPTYLNSRRSVFLVGTKLYFFWCSQSRITTSTMIGVHDSTMLVRPPTRPPESYIWCSTFPNSLPFLFSFDFKFRFVCRELLLDGVLRGRQRGLGSWPTSSWSRPPSMSLLPQTNRQEPRHCAIFRTAKFFH